MAIEMTIEYDRETYRRAVRAKVLSMPRFHLFCFMPVLVFMLLDSVKSTAGYQGWWMTAALWVCGLAAVNGLASYFFVGRIAARFAAHSELSTPSTLQRKQTKSVSTSDVVKRRLRGFFALSGYDRPRRADMPTVTRGNKVASEQTRIN